jgi:hypothetical protein
VRLPGSEIGMRTLVLGEGLSEETARTIPRIPARVKGVLRDLRSGPASPKGRRKPQGPGKKRT